MAVKEIIKDHVFLSIKSEKVTKGESIQSIITDLIDTAKTHESCVGLAAVQIGYHKRICLVYDGKNEKEENRWIVLINPMIVQRSTDKHASTESCLSIDGERVIQRHNKITIMHSELNGKIKKSTFGGQRSVVIQHEIDHFNGILV